MTSASSLPPLIAILRGLVPEGASDVGEALCEAGFRCLEVPLNLPRPLESIERLRQRLDGRVLVGAGTVLSMAQVDDVAAAGGQIVISPNTCEKVIAHAKARGLFVMPGFFTPSEAFAAIGAGADALKYFPAEVGGPVGLRAVKVVLPPEVPIYAVGGVDVGSVGDWIAVGAAGLGLGSAVFAPGMVPGDVGARAAAFVAAWRNADR
jgi:2-dehydro-3-deoxyphosphogalactonate aldolase